MRFRTIYSIATFLELKSSNFLLTANADGIVKKYYLQNNTETENDLLKGKYLFYSVDYIEERLRHVKQIAWYIYVSLLFRVRGQLSKDEKAKGFIHNEFTNHMLKYIDDNNDSIPKILMKWKSIESDTYAQLVDQMNYFLYYKLNNRLDEIKKEIDQFDPDAYDLVFKMFYAIITDSKEAYRLTMEYFKQIPDDDFFVIYEWPVFKLVRAKEGYIEYFKHRIENFGNSMESDIIDK